MSAPMGVAVGIVLLALGCFLVSVLVNAWRRAVQDSGTPPLFSLIGRVGEAAKRFDPVANAEVLALAVRRCTFCASKDRCRAWLASGRREGNPADCPNAALLERIGER